jgi:hypothetical protein
MRCHGSGRWPVLGCERAAGRDPGDGANSTSARTDRKAAAYPPSSSSTVSGSHRAAGRAGRRASRSADTRCSRRPGPEWSARSRPSAATRPDGGAGEGLTYLARYGGEARDACLDPHKRPSPATREPGRRRLTMPVLQYEPRCRGTQRGSSRRWRARGPPHPRCPGCCPRYSRRLATGWSHLARRTGRPQESPP